MLSVIAKGFFAESPLIFFPVLALLLFIVIFSVISFRVLRSSDEELAKAANIPLGNDDGETSPAVSGANHHE